MSDEEGQQFPAEIEVEVKNKRYYVPPELRDEWLALDGYELQSPKYNRVSIMHLFQSVSEIYHIMSVLQRSQAAQNRGDIEQANTLLQEGAERSIEGLNHLRKWLTYVMAGDLGLDLGAVGGDDE